METWQNIKTGEILIGKMKKTGSVGGEFVTYNKISGKEGEVIYTPFTKESTTHNISGGFAGKG